MIGDINEGTLALSKATGKARRDGCRKLQLCADHDSG
jgi:hypothetical protein